MYYICGFITLNAADFYYVCGLLGIDQASKFHLSQSDWASLGHWIHN